MTEFSVLLEQSAANAWPFIPSAILLGALHGLEPGHSKTMMAAFIIAVRGTVSQAILLGLSATISHTAIVWIIALSGLYFGRTWNVETNEPYFQIASALFMIGIAVWMLWRIRKEHRSAHHHKDHHRHVYNRNSLRNPHSGAITRIHNITQKPQDAHALAHAKEIEQKFSSRQATTKQIIMFGLTGGLIPCPASITVLLICLQLKQIALGATLVLCFSIGLALTMVFSGVLAALSVKQVAARWSGFGNFADRAPYFSGALILCVGVYVGYQGVRGLL